MISIRLEPLDTWFFRGGAPFVRGDTPQEDVGSLFPPHPATVIGALRAALARARGWDGRRRWPGEFDEVLGDGPDDLGKLSFEGPFLLRDGKPLFRSPRHLLLGDGGKPSALLRPGPPVSCDLGEAVRLPAHDGAAGLKVASREWLTLEGFQAVLRGEVPPVSAVVPQENLWVVESRIGLERDANTRHAKEGMLYSTRHIRPKAGVSLGMRIRGLPGDWPTPDGAMLPLGGESRLAAWGRWEDDSELSEGGATGQAALIALAPLDLEPAVIRGERPLDPLGVRVVSACLDRPQRIGGWDSLRHRPLPLRSVLAPGSVLFCETPGKTFAGSLRIGARQASGFGLVACGRWPPERETH